MADNEIKTKIVVDSKNAEKNLKSTEKAIDGVDDAGVKAGKNITKAFSDIGKVAGGVLTADAIRSGFTFLIDSVGALTTDFAALGDGIAKTSAKLGVGVEALQELRFAAQQSGVESNTFDIALQRLTRRAADAAQGAGPAVKAFEQLGVTLKDNNGNVRQAEDIFTDLAGAFGGVESQSEKVRLAFQLFDSEGVALVNVLDQGEEGLTAFREEAQRLGFVLGEDAAKASEDFTDRQNELSKAFEGVRNSVAAKLLPSLTELFKATTDLIVENRVLILDILSAAPRVFRFAAEAAGVFITALAVQKVLEFNSSVGGISGIMDTVVTSLRSGTLAVNLFKAAATLGLTIAIDAIITKAFEFREILGSWEAVLANAGTIATIVFKQIQAVLLQAGVALAVFTDKLGLTSGNADLARGSVAQLKGEVDALNESLKAQNEQEGGGIGPDAAKTKLNADANLVIVKDSLELAKEAELAAQDELTRQRAVAFEERLIQDEEFQAQLDGLTQLQREKAIQELVSQQKTEEDIKRESLIKQAKDNADFNQKILEEDTELGKSLLKLEQQIGKDKVAQLQSTGNSLARLQQSQNSVLQGIGKAAAVTQIGIDTAQAATAALTAFSFIPFVGPALGFAAAGAIIAFGAEQVSSVLSAQQGGIVDFQGGASPTRDSVPSLLQPGELVVPTQNFDEVVNAVASERTQSAGSTGSGEGPSARIELSLRDDLIEFIEAKLIERRNLTLSLEGA